MRIASITLIKTFGLIALLGVANQAAAERPLILSVAPVSAKAGEILNYQIQAITSDGQALQYKLHNAPSGVTLSSTGQLLWEPLRTQYGKHEFFASVINMQGEVTSQFLRIYVIDPNNTAPAIEPTNVPTAIVGQELSFQIHVTDAEGDPPRFEMLSGPPGASIHPLEGVVTWTPALTDIGAHQIIIAAMDGFGGKTHNAFDITVSAP